MNEQLLIRLPSSDQDVINWMVWSDQEQEVIAAGELNGSSELTTLQDKASQRRVIVLVPACDVTQHRLELARAAQRSWQQVVPFMLEEQIAQDPEELHICLLAKTKDSVEVACISEPQMLRWQAMLATANIQSQAWYIDAFCLPQPAAEQASALQINQQWLFRFSDGRAVCIDQSWLSVALPLLVQDYPDLVIQHYSPAPDLSIEGLEWQAQDAELPIKLLADGAKKSAVNLLQGRFASANPLSKLWSQWQKAALAAGLCFALALSYQLLDKYNTEQQVADVNANIRQVYKQVFPGVSRIRDSRIRSDFRRAVASLEQPQQQDFLLMMSQLSSAFKQSQAFKPLSLRYEQKKSEIRLQAQAPSFQSFEQFRQALQPYESEQGTLSNKAGSVVGTVIIRKAS